MYLAANKSIIRAVVDLANDLDAKGLLPREVQVMDLDGHANLSELPAIDIIGVGSVELTENDRTYAVTAGVTILTMEDPGVGRLKLLADLVGKHFKTQTKLAVYQPETAEVLGTMVVKPGTEISPVARAEQRNAITVVFSAEIIPGPLLLHQA